MARAVPRSHGPSGQVRSPGRDGMSQRSRRTRTVAWCEEANVRGAFRLTTGTIYEPHGLPTGYMVASERFVRKAVVRWLTGKNQRARWEIVNTAETGEHGVDIEAERYGIKFFIEAKGDADPKTVAKKNLHTNRGVKFQIALAQIISRMRRKEAALYGLALPLSYRDQATRNVPWNVSRKLKLHLFLVNDKGEVEHLTSRELKALQPRS